MQCTSASVQLCLGVLAEFALPPREFGSQPYQPHLAGSRPHNPGGTKGGSGGSHGGQRLSTQATSSAQASPELGSKRARDIAAPAHLGALMHSQTAHPGYDPRLAVRASLLPEQILETRLSEVIETATSILSQRTRQRRASNGEAVCSEGSPAQAADEAWQQTISGLQGPGVRTPEDFSAPRKSRLSGPQLQAQLSRLTDRSCLGRLEGHAPLKGCMAAGHQD